MHLPLYLSFFNLFVAYLTFKSTAADELNVVKCLEKMCNIFKVTGVPKITVSNYDTDSVKNTLTAKICAQNAIQFLTLNSFPPKFASTMDYTIYDYYLSMGKQLDPVNIKSPRYFCQRNNLQFIEHKFEQNDCFNQLAKFEVNFGKIPQKSLREYRETNDGICNTCAFGLCSKTLPNFVIENALYLFDEDGHMPGNYDRLYMEHIKNAVLENSTPEPLNYCTNLYLNC